MNEEIQPTSKEERIEHLKELLKDQSSKLAQSEKKIKELETENARAIMIEETLESYKQTISRQAEALKSAKEVIEFCSANHAEDIKDWEQREQWLKDNKELLEELK